MSTKLKHMATNVKYRPVLTAPQISHMLTLAKNDMMWKESIDADLSISLISSLSVFQAKINNAGVQAAYTITSAQPNLMEQLGAGDKVEFVGDPRQIDPSTTLAAHAVDDEAIGVPEVKLPENYLFKEAYWSDCYAKYNIAPADCTLEELHAAQEHMYLNDLMTPEQLLAFETRDIKVVGNIYED